MRWGYVVRNGDWPLRASTPPRGQSRLGASSVADIGTHRCLPDGRIILTPSGFVPALYLDEVDVLALSPEELVQATAWTAAYPESRRKLPLRRSERGHS